LAEDRRPDPLLDEQIAYYRARAPEYDEWFNREGRYDRGPAHREHWFREFRIAEEALRAAAPLGRVLELACGTGLWTRHLASIGTSVIAVDASPEAIAINQRRAGAANVDYRLMDIFSSMPEGEFDTVFFAFWLSHVPSSRFEWFWLTLRERLRPGGRVFFIDSLREPLSTATNHQPPGDSDIIRRKLNDGREFQIVKVFYHPLELEQRLASMGWRGAVQSTGSFFLYGQLM
jgi:demethylmenaquinone methyltransferase/2-methoxy-6-polyprenyl-1,4-benzoquinol methylase